MAMPATSIPYAKPNVTVIPANPKLARPWSNARILRVAAYARVSTELEEQQSSYAAQIDYYTEKITKNPEWRLAGIYADEGITGTLLKKRKNFLRMLHDCKAGKIDMVLTKSFSRFARNTVDSIQTIRDLKAMGIPIIFEKENINTMDVDTETFITLLSCMAQAESESISGNVKWGVRRRFADGKVRYNYAHWFGYIKGEDGQPQVIEAEAEIVRGIYCAYLAGQSLQQIAAGLNAEGTLRRDGKPWVCSVIQSILKNERYCGDAICQKTFVQDCISKKVVKNQGELPMYFVKDAHEGIVSRAVWHSAQAEMAKRVGKKKVQPKPSGTGMHKYSGKYALTGLLICGECGSAYQRRVWKQRDGANVPVWRCRTRTEHGTKYCKDSPTFEESRLHDAIASALREYLAGREHLLATLEGNIQTAMAAELGGDSPEGLRYRKKELEAALYELAAALGGDEDVIEAHGAEFNRINEELANVQQALEEMQAQETGQASHGEEMGLLRDALERVPLALDGYDDKLVRQVVEEVRIVGKSRLEVVFRDGRVIGMEI